MTLFFEPTASVRILELQPRSPARASFAVRPRPAVTVLEQEARGQFNRGRAQAGLPPAGLDPLLSEVAEAYARLLAREGATAAACAVDALFDWVGLCDVYPTFHAREAVGGGDAGFLGFLAELGAQGGGRTEEEVEPGLPMLGVGRSLEAGRWIHVAVLVRRLLDPDPLLRRPAPGAWVTLSGQLAPGVAELTAYRFVPGEGTEELPCACSPAGQLQLTWQMPPVPGPLYLELAGQTKLGPRMVARLELDSRPAPEQTCLRLLLPPPGEETLPSAAVTARLLELINRTRQTHGAPALEADPLASAVASRFAGEMAEQDFTGHLTSHGRDPGERFRSAGLAVTMLGECVARDRSVTSAFLALMRSLAHRRLLLDPLFGQVGLGAAERRRSGGPEWVVVCDLFRPLVHPDCELGMAELARELDRQRQRAGVGPLRRDPALHQVARELAIIIVEHGGRDPGWVDPWLRQQLAQLPEPVDDCSVIIQGVTDPWTVARADEALLSGAWTHAALAHRMTRDPDGLPLAVVVVLLTRGRAD